MNFCKFHGFGNDYLVFEAKELQNLKSVNDFARRVCDRHYGVGADGVAVIQKSNDNRADFASRIFNPDGSEAKFSGNGTRCAVAYLHYKQIWTNADLRLSTKSGVKNYHLLETIADGHYRFEAELGTPKFDAASIPFAVKEPLEIIADFPLSVDGEIFAVSAVSVGNPVCCTFVEDFDALDWRTIGREIEMHPAFPERANVVFVKILDRENIELRIWERGAGETFASGTCAVGAAVVCAAAGKTSRRVSVLSSGGTTEVVWRETDDEILLTGRADFVFCGEWNEE